MPRLAKPLPKTRHPSECEALCLVHQYHVGIFVVICFVFAILSAIGVFWDKFGVNTALTIAAFLLNLIAVVK